MKLNSSFACTILLCKLPTQNSNNQSIQRKKRDYDDGSDIIQITFHRKKIDFNQWTNLKLKLFKITSISAVSPNFITIECIDQYIIFWKHSLFNLVLPIMLGEWGYRWDIRRDIKRDFIPCMSVILISFIVDF